MKKIGVLALFFLLSAAVCASAAQVNKVAAVVNGKVITMFDLQKEAIPELARAGLKPSSPKAEIDKVLRKVLDMMIMDILVAQEAERLKATVSRTDVDNELAKMMKMRGMSKKRFEEALRSQNLTVDALRKNIEKNIIRQKVMGMEVGRKVVVTPQEISDYYERHKDSLYNRQGLHMGILVYAPNVNASSIAAQIKSGKISFEEACAKYSMAPNRDKGGDAGPVDWDRLNPEWDKRLNSMKPGDVTEIFNLQNHKAQVHLFRPGGGVEKTMTLQEATPQIDMILRQPKARERFEDYSRQLRQKAVIDIRL